MWPRPKTSILRPVDPTTPPLPPWAQVKGHWPTLVGRRVPAKKTKICREPILPLICRDLASPASRKWIPVLLWELKMESRCKYFCLKITLLCVVICPQTLWIVLLMKNVNIVYRKSVLSPSDSNVLPTYGRYFRTDSLPRPNSLPRSNLLPRPNRSIRKSLSSGALTKNIPPSKLPKSPKSRLVRIRRK